MIAMAASVGTVLLNSFGGRIASARGESVQPETRPEGTPVPADEESFAPGEGRTLAITVKGMH
jgi:hypothetical protein